MKPNAFVKSVAACTAALWLGAGAAQAHGDSIYWSIGVGSPGVHVGVASAPPVLVRPPLVYAPPPVVYMPPPRPVMYAPPPVVYGPPPRWRHHHHHHGWGPGGPGYGGYR